MEPLEDSPGKREGKPSQDAAQRLLWHPGGGERHTPGARGGRRGERCGDRRPRPDPSWPHPDQKDRDSLRTKGAASPWGQRGGPRAGKVVAVDLEGSPEALAGDIRLWVADPALAEECGSGSGGPALRPSPHPQPPWGAVPSHCPQSAAQQGSGFLTHPQGSPDPPRLPPGPWTPRSSHRLSDALQCLQASPLLCCLLCESFPPSLGSGLLPRSRWQSLAPLGQDFGGRCVRCITPPTGILQATLPSQLKAFSPTVWPSVHRQPRSARPGAPGAVDSVPFTEEHTLGLSHDPGLPAPSRPAGCGFPRTGLYLHGQGSCGRLATSRSSLLPSGPASS